MEVNNENSLRTKIIIKKKNNNRDINNNEKLIRRNFIKRLLLCIKDTMNIIKFKKINKKC